LTRLKTNTIGATDGSIIAAIIVTHTPRYQPSRRARFPARRPSHASAWYVTIQATRAPPSSAPETATDLGKGHVGE
jgi:hypothetical protein